MMLNFRTHAAAAAQRAGARGHLILQEFVFNCVLADFLQGDLLFSGELR